MTRALRENETYKEKTGAKGSGYLQYMERCTISVIDHTEIRVALLTAILSECQNKGAKEKRGQLTSAHVVGGVSSEPCRSP